MVFSSHINDIADDEEIARVLQSESRSEAVTGNDAGCGEVDAWSASALSASWGWGFFGAGGDDSASPPQTSAPLPSSAAAALSPSAPTTTTWTAFPAQTTIASRLGRKKTATAVSKLSPSASTPDTSASTISPTRSTLSSSSLSSSGYKAPAPTSVTEGCSPRGFGCGPGFDSRAINNDLFVDSDRAVARRLDQQFRDDDVAARITEAETQTLSAKLAIGAGIETNLVDVGGSRVMPVARSGGGGRGSQSTSMSETPRRRLRSSFHRKVVFWSLRVVALVLMLGCAVIACLVAFGGDMDDDLDPASWLPGWPEQDPNAGTANNIWESGDDRTGLTLQVINNVDEKWREHFLTAVEAWNAGDPDSVTLYLRESASPDPDCRAVRKVMKACNGNYGPTEWRGVNQILLQGDYIITSVAKMNDYYLDGTSRAQKQYTMCHELGHGLGLGHTDENFYNRDLGNCMDYTERPENNMLPSRMNFEMLEQLYGTGTTFREALDAVPTGEGETGGGGRRKSANTRPGGDGGRRRAAADETERAEDEFETYAEFLSEPVQLLSSLSTTEGGNSYWQRRSSSNPGWRILHRSERAEHRERDLGDGYTIRTSVLLA